MQENASVSNLFLDKAMAEVEEFSYTNDQGILGSVLITNHEIKTNRKAINY